MPDSVPCFLNALTDLYVTTVLESVILYLLAYISNERGNRSSERLGNSVSVTQLAK